MSEKIVLKPFIGDVISEGKLVTKKFAPGNIFKGGKGEDNAIREKKGLIGSKKDYAKLYPENKDGETLRVHDKVPDKVEKQVQAQAKTIEDQAAKIAEQEKVIGELKKDFEDLKKAVDKGNS